MHVDRYNKKCFSREWISAISAWVNGTAVDGITGRVFSSLPYAIVMDEGRTPGARMPPPAAIELWVQRKLGLTGTEAARAAFAIARSIGEKGIDPRAFADEAFSAGQNKVDRLFEILGDQITRALTTEGTGA